MCVWLKRRKRSKRGRSKYSNAALTCKLSSGSPNYQKEKSSGAGGGRHKSSVAVSMTPSTLNDLPSTSVDSIKLPDSQLRPIEESHIFAWRDHKTVLKIKKVLRSPVRETPTEKPKETVESNQITRTSRAPLQLTQNYAVSKRKKSLPTLTTSKVSPSPTSSVVSIISTSPSSKVATK